MSKLVAGTNVPNRYFQTREKKHHHHHPNLFYRSLIFLHLYAFSLLAVSFSTQKQNDFDVVLFFSHLVYIFRGVFFSFFLYTSLRVFSFGKKTIKKQKKHTYENRCLVFVCLHMDMRKIRWDYYTFRKVKMT